jgi:hypothetical protein
MKYELPFVMTRVDRVGNSHTTTGDIRSGVAKAGREWTLNEWRSRHSGYILRCHEKETIAFVKTVKKKNTSRDLRAALLMLTQSLNTQHRSWREATCTRCDANVADTTYHAFTCESNTDITDSLKASIHSILDNEARPLEEKERGKWDAIHDDAFKAPENWLRADGKASLKQLMEEKDLVREDPDNNEEAVQVKTRDGEWSLPIEGGVDTIEKISYEYVRAKIQSNDANASIRDTMIDYASRTAAAPPAPAPAAPAAAPAVPAPTEPLPPHAASENADVLCWMNPKVPRTCRSFKDTRVHDPEDPDNNNGTDDQDTDTEGEEESSVQDNQRVAFNGNGYPIEDEYQQLFNHHPFAGRIGIMPRRLKRFLLANGKYANKETIRNIKDTIMEHNAQLVNRYLSWKPP